MVTDVQTDTILAVIRRLKTISTLMSEDAPPFDAPIVIQDTIDEAIVALEALVSRAAWPEPTVELPDLATIEEWLWEDGGCEATDGCWCDPDGTCHHGHPSWLLVLGFI